MVSPSNEDIKKKANTLIGEEFLHDGLINENQVRQVLTRQAQVGGKFGSLLIENGIFSDQ